MLLDVMSEAFHYLEEAYLPDGACLAPFAFQDSPCDSAECLLMLVEGPLQMLGQLAAPCGVREVPSEDECQDRCRNLVVVESILACSHLYVGDAVLGNLIDEVNRRLVEAAVVAVALEAIVVVEDQCFYQEYDSTLHQDFVAEAEAIEDSQDAEGIEDDQHGDHPVALRDYASVDIARGCLAALVDLVG